MQSLLDTFFIDVNIYFPVLHRPSFERAIAEGEHLRDESFGSVVLLVCALGSRFSYDPRVYVEGQHTPQAAGWEWFNQVQQTMKVINMDPPTVYDLQMAYVSGYLRHRAHKYLMQVCPPARIHVFVWPGFATVVLAHFGHRP